jgi:hypothetical protein
VRQVVAILALTEHVDGLVDGFCARAEARGLFTVVLPALADQEVSEPATVLLRLEAAEPGGAHTERPAAQRRRVRRRPLTEEVDL